MTKWGKIKKELLKNKEVREEYDLRRDEFAAIKKVLDLRLKKKMTQRELAELMRTKQSAIARVENNCVSPTIEYLAKMAKAMGKKLVVDFK